MKLSERHQKIFDEVCPDGYDASKIVKRNGDVVDESHLFHIMYVKIVKDGKWTRGVPAFQKYSVRDWQHYLAIFDKHDIAAVTGHSEFSVIHDPTAKVGVAKAKSITKVKANVKSEPKEVLK